MKSKYCIAGFALFALWIIPAVTMGQTNETVIETQLQRSDLTALIKQGPQALIASVDVNPHSVKGRFVGYKIVGAKASSLMANSQTVQVGDVILSVNGHSLERPDQFMRAWEGLGKKKQITVAVLRGVQRIVFRWNLTP